MKKESYSREKFTLRNVTLTLLLGLSAPLLAQPTLTELANKQVANISRDGTAVGGGNGFFGQKERALAPELKAMSVLAILSRV